MKWPQTQAEPDWNLQVERKMMMQFHHPFLSTCDEWPERPFFLTLLISHKCFISFPGKCIKTWKRVSLLLQQHESRFFMSSSSATFSLWLKSTATFYAIKASSLLLLGCISPRKTFKR